MSAEIFSQPQVQSSTPVRDAMLNDLNYEVVYSKVIEEYPLDARTALVAATRNAYLHMHRILCGHPGQQGPAEVRGIRGRGAWNQDFFEV